MCTHLRKRTREEGRGGEIVHCVCGVVIVCQLLNTIEIFTVALVHAVPQILRSAFKIQLVALIWEADWLAALECFKKLLIFTTCPLVFPSTLCRAHHWGKDGCDFAREYDGNPGEECLTYVHKTIKDCTGDPVFKVDA